VRPATTSFTIALHRHGVSNVIRNACEIGCDNTPVPKDESSDPFEV